MRPVAVSNPPNPWTSTAVEYLEGAAPEMRIEVFEDHSRTILARNDSPDVGFTYSVNPYRGCFHACAYCYARPGHEYLGFGAGTDFERRIVVKPDAPALLRKAFRQKSWRHETVVMSGVTDCYQPLEASYRLTRGCLEVCATERNPVGIITKAPLIERDVDLLQAIARVASLQVIVSIPFWDPDKARAIEPYVATPARRMRTIRVLADAGISVGINVAPIIPGLNDQEIPAVLEAARAAGASSAAYVLLRLPGPVASVFEERVRARMPLAADRILHRIRGTRGGGLSDARFGVRGRGEGPYAEMIRSLFVTTSARLGLTTHRSATELATFEEGSAEASERGRSKSRAPVLPSRTTLPTPDNPGQLGFEFQTREIPGRSKPRE
jgi:DNA repair photolyase